MKEKLTFLRKYNKNINIIHADEISLIPLGEIPDIWCEIFQIDNCKNKIDMFMNIWKKILNNELSNIISYLDEYLENIEIIRDDEKYSILYTIRNSKGKVLYYEGRSPKEDFKNEELKNSWSKIPESIRAFYENIHNGFYEYSSESMGLVPLESVTYLGDEDLEWSIIDELSEPMQINLKTSFGFFSNGMGSYIAIDYNNCNNLNATYWSAKKQPKYNISFWDYVDEWIVIGLEN